LYRLPASAVAPYPGVTYREIEDAPARVVLLRPPAPPPPAVAAIAALARDLFTDAPGASNDAATGLEVLVVLDEPTASLDALSEAALFDRYTAAARELAAAQGTVTPARLAPLLDRASGRSDRCARAGKGARARLSGGAPRRGRHICRAARVASARISVTRHLCEVVSPE
jgi:hypothetical protein